MMRKVLSYIFLVFTISCNSSHGNQLFELLDPRITGFEAINFIESSNDLNVFKYRNFYNGGGVAIGDVNNDGLADIYLTHNLRKNKLFLNKGDFSFEEISEQAQVTGAKKWSTGVVMVDINNDGWLDIYVCNAGLDSDDERENELFINNQDGTFSERAKEFNLAHSGITTHAAFFDYDKDGDLDVYLLNNSFIPVTTLNYNNKRNLKDDDWNVSALLKGGGDRLFQNNNGKFTDVTDQAGIYSSLIGFGLGVTLGDVNNDGYIDIYVSNDFYERDYLYINQRDGSFVEDIQSFLNHISHSSMGADIADLNNDGFTDIFVTDMLPRGDTRLKETTEFEGFDIYKIKQEKGFYHQFMQNTLQLNNQNDTFSEISTFAGIEATDWSWGALILDMDNDGNKDLFVCNGIYHELTNQDFVNYFANEVVQSMALRGEKGDIKNIINKMPIRPLQNMAFKNNQNGIFSNKSTDWGFDKKTFSNGAAYGDLDNDGDLDLVINNVNQEAMLYKSYASERGANYLQLKLEGDKNNTYAIGSKIRVYVNNQIIYSELIPSRGFQSSVDYINTIGLGKNQNIDSLIIEWPNGKESRYYNFVSNQRVILSIDEAKSKSIKKVVSRSKLYLAEIPFNIKHHKENSYVDYDKEVLVPKMLSREGPPIAVGDVNDDGLDDVFIGNASGTPPQLLLQQQNGFFQSTNEDLFFNEKQYEDTAAVFIDIDNDNDLDLFVGSGGNDTTIARNLFQDRIYVNDGKGSFSFQSHMLPNYISNTSVIAPYDMDHDGDVDFFIGNRSFTGVYGITPNSFFLENNGKGVFKNSSNLKAYDAVKKGMITDAKWIELTGDGIKDLVIVGDWMSPFVFENKTQYLKEIKTNLSEYNGWWSAIIEGDFNDDGHIDFILGNKGLNSTYTGNKESKARLFINDFDDNGTFDQILTRFIGGKDKPIHVRNELINQIPKIKKDNIRFSEYAKKGVRDLFPKEIVESSLIKEVNETRTILVLNYGMNDYKIKPLPIQVQWNSVNTGVVEDFNKDGHIDVLLAGGEDNLKPQFGKLDAGYGELLLGDGKGNFSWQTYSKSGLKIRGAVRSSNIIKWQSKKAVIFGINDKKAVFYVSTN